MSVLAAHRISPGRRTADVCRCGGSGCGARCKGKSGSGCSSCSHGSQGGSTSGLAPSTTPGTAPGTVGTSLGTNLAAGIAGMSGSGAPLTHSVRAYFEPRLGVDLSGVRVQTGPRAADLAQRLDARAFTVGSDVFFNAGQYRPESAEGRQLLAHELAHVVQAPAGPALQGLTVSRPSDTAERDADLLARHLIAPHSGAGQGIIPPPSRDRPHSPGRPPTLPSMPTVDDLGLFGAIDDACEHMRKLGLLPVQRGVYWKGHPAPRHPTPCNTHPDAPHLEDPLIPSAAKCRGVCGPDCAKSCQAQPDEHRCVTNRDGVSHSICIYKGVQSCGTHRGCRNHDACYDWCSEHGHDDIADRCHRWCDLGCVCDYDTFTCIGWALGEGPFDGSLRFYDESISQIVGPFPGTCPATAVMVTARMQQYLDLKDRMAILDMLAQAPESERLHLLTAPMARERLLAAVGFVHWPITLAILEGAPSWKVPSLDAATVFLADRAIQDQHRDVALSTILATLHRRSIIDPNLAGVTYVGGAHPEDAVTFFRLVDDPVTHARRATPPVRIEVYDKAFVDTGWLFSTVMHEHVHVLQVLHGYPAGDFQQGEQRPESVERDEVESYLWEIEHAVGTGLIRNATQMSDLGRRLTTHFTAMRKDQQDRYRIRFDAAQAVVAHVAAGVPQLGIDDARRELARTSREIADLLSRRRGREATVDAQIEELRRRRAKALVTVALVDNPAIQVVRPGDPGTYRVASPDAAGGIRYLYGGISVGWHLAPASTSAYTLGGALGVGGQMAVAGTAIQGRVHPFPPDVDFDEHLHFVANTRQEAAERAARTIVDGILRISGGPVPGRDDLEFRHLVAYPAGGKSTAMSLGQLQRPDGVSKLAHQIATLNGGNLNTFWRGFLADGRFINITRVVFVTAQRQDGTPLLTAGSNADFNLAYLEDPTAISATPLAVFAWEMCCDARRRARQGNWLKAAKRAYNYFSTIGDVAHMTALEPVFTRPEAEMEMYASVVEGLRYALLKWDRDTPEPRTRILSATMAREQAEEVARKVLELLPDSGGGRSPHAIAKELREIAGQFRARDRWGNLEQAPWLAHRLQAVLKDIRNHVSASLKDRVRPVIEAPLAAACPNCGRSSGSGEP